jgi:outer membrane protein assembly factor BamD (BamD/ComL family)
MSSISSVSSATNPYQTDTQNPWQQRAQDFKSLQSALQSGDLSGAQQAFASLQQNQPTSSQTASTTTASNRNSQASNAFQALQSALGTGNLEAAQQAFSSLKQSMQSGRVAGTGGHHHHHHGGGSASSTTQNAGASSSGSSAQNLSTFLNTLA